MVGMIHRKDVKAEDLSPQIQRLPFREERV